MRIYWWLLCAKIVNQCVAYSLRLRLHTKDYTIERTMKVTHHHHMTSLSYWYTWPMWHGTEPASFPPQLQWNQMMAKDENRVSKETSQLDHHQTKKLRLMVMWKPRRVQGMRKTVGDQNWLGTEGVTRVISLVKKSPRLEMSF